MTDEERAARNARIVARYAAGDPTSAIAADEGVHRVRVSKIALAAGLPARRPRPNTPGRAERDAAIVARYAAGESTATIAADYGLTTAHVSVLAAKHGIRRAKRDPLDEVRRLLDEAARILLEERMTDEWALLDPVRDAVTAKHRWVLADRQREADLKRAV